MAEFSAVHTYKEYGDYRRAMLAVQPGDKLAVDGSDPRTVSTTNTLGTKAALERPDGGFDHLRVEDGNCYFRCGSNRRVVKELTHLHAEELPDPTLQVNQRVRDRENGRVLTVRSVKRRRADRYPIPELNDTVAGRNKQYPDGDAVVLASYTDRLMQPDIEAKKFAFPESRLVSYHGRACSDGSDRVVEA